MIEDLKNIVKHTSVYSLGTILSKVVSFIMIPIYTRYLSTSDYGVLELITLVASVFSLVLSLRLTSGMLRYYYEYTDELDRNRLVSTILISVTLLAILTVVFISQYTELLSRLVIGSMDYADFFVAVLISMGFEMSSTISLTYLRILEKSVFFITISLLQLAIGFAFNIYFIVFLDFGVLGILYSMVIANGIACLILSAYTFRKVKLHFNFPMLKKVTLFSIPMILAGILIFILNMGDRFLLSRLGDLGEVGIYALGYKFGMLLGLFFGSPFLTMWAPKRLEIYQRNTNSDEFYSRILLYFILVLSFGGLLISLGIRDLLMLLATPEFLPAYRVVPFVILGYAFYNLYYIFDFGFYVHKKIYWYSIINATAVVINIGLNLIMIPKYGALGAAIVTAISFCVCPVFAYLVSQKYHPIRYDFTRVAQVIGFTLIFYLLGNSISIDSIYVSISVRLLFVASFPVLLYFIGFFDATEMDFIRTKCLAKLGFAK